MNQNTLSTLETAVIELLLRGHHPVLAALRHQLAHCQVVDRELTGAGFCTRLTVDPSVPAAPLTHNLIRLGDVEADLEGLEHGAGFLLLVEDGYLRELEGYSYEEPWPARISNFSVRYVAGERELGGLDSTSSTVRKLGGEDT